MDKIYKIYKKLIKTNNYFRMNLHMYTFNTISFIDYTQNKEKRMSFLDNIKEFIGSKWITQSITFEANELQNHS